MLYSVLYTARAPQPIRLATIHTVAAPAPNRDGHVFPHAKQNDTDVNPFNGSVVPA